MSGLCIFTQFFCFRYNEMKIASQNLEKEDGEYRARTSRLMKWKEMVRESQKHLALPENPPERIM